MLGCGQVDPLSKPTAVQRFTVLEWLEHSLEELTPTQSSSSAFHPRRVFAESSSRLFPTVLPVLLQVSAVLRYLHSEVSAPVPDEGQPENDSCAGSAGKLEIIHRAVIPEHFRFNGDSPQAGGVKLTSFMACHLTWLPPPPNRETGAGTGTGTRTTTGRGSSGKLEWCAAPHHPTTALCYTPPEVAMRLSLSTKADIYAFALLAWQLMKSRKPYSGLSKSDFMYRVIYKSKRPKISRSWSESFSSLLEACWLSEPVGRPPMHVVHNNLLVICQQINE